MGTELKAGSYKNASLDADSMAKAMEQAFIKEWPSVMKTDSPDVNTHLQLMFVSIAQGVVKHLEENKDAFVVDRINNGGNFIEEGLYDIRARTSDFV